ncbi:phosphotransferase family protein [Brachybacterium phenoliresistens]|uniref:phosphotransferase family protein n=1 Tax=Brachybacterium phenoliresistens TaxID=396014 RepID=UPI0031D754CA
MRDLPSSPVDQPADDPVLRRILRAAGIPQAGRFRAKAGWTSRAWVGEEHVVRRGDGRFRDAYAHEAAVAGLLRGSAVPHARHLAHGVGPDGPWYVSARLPGRTLQEAWPGAGRAERRAMIESLGSALRALHRIPVPAGLRPPWLADALAGGPWPAFHPPVLRGLLPLIETARRRPGQDSRLLSDADAWVRERLGLFAEDVPCLVHGDLHGSNVMVDRGRVTGLIDFAEASAQPADVELDTLLRWCARSAEYPAAPGGPVLEAGSLAEVPAWLHSAYPELFAAEHLRARLDVYDMHEALALLVHHPDPEVRAAVPGRIALLLSGHSHLDGLLP